MARVNIGNKWRVFIIGLVLAIIIIVLALVTGSPKASTESGQAPVGYNTSAQNTGLNVTGMPMSSSTITYPPVSGQGVSSSGQSVSSEPGSVPGSLPTQIPRVILPINVTPGQPVVGYTCTTPNSGGIQPMCVIAPTPQ